MRAQVLMSLLNELRKSVKMRGLCLFASGLINIIIQEYTA